MRGLDGSVLYAASDLMGFLGCRHSIFLDLVDLQTPLEKAEDNAQMQLIQERGLEHEREYLKSLCDDGLSIIEIAEDDGLQDRVAQTLVAMQQGVDVIYQAALWQAPWHGFADFLHRVETPSALGDFSYEAMDTKLSRRPEPRHVLQLCVYSDLLETAQGARPHSMSLVLGEGRKSTFRYNDFAYYYATIKQRFAAYAVYPPDTSKAEPCSFCTLCKWRELCQAQWQADDHLSLIADIRRTQIAKLEVAGITTVQALAQLGDDVTVPGMMRQTLGRLRAQARLQVAKRESGEDHVELLPPIDGRGFARLPQPDTGDLFFDMEGDPLYPDGLEYLFGFYYVVDGEPVFKLFWAHDHKAERQTFEAVIDFITAHLIHYPNAHIYHYNHYEETAIKRLSSRYATREAAVDDLLRRQKLVDLYKVVREAIRVSEPSYSLKNLETFYMEKREAEVTNAGDSIVVYEQWRKNGDDALLQQISKYNEDDCRSTLLLRGWLLTQRPADVPWFDGTASEPSEAQQQAQSEAEEWRVTYERQLLDNAADQDRAYREIVSQLLEFHRREDKPQWWAMFDRQSRSDEELVEDTECLGGLQADPDQPPYPDKRSLVFTYRFPPQETKLKMGDSCFQAATLNPAGTIIAFDPDQRTVSLRRGKTQGLLPATLSVIPGGPIRSDVLKQAVYRYADGVIAGNGRFAAIQALLRRAMPTIDDHPEDMPIISENRDVLASTITAVANLRDSYLFIQGPPGTGKTYTASHVIVALLRKGKKVGVSSNSHKAINNLLTGIERVAIEQGVQFQGLKKSTGGQPETFFNGVLIKDVTRNEQIVLHADLIAGTAWLFAREEFDEILDYLFVDEAGQVSLANIIAIGTSTRNIVLVGDQMQLGQPIQGVHPGDSGTSTLAYLLQDDATVAPDRGIFLHTTWRMHDNICRFISDAVYDGALHPAMDNRQQVLLLNGATHPALREHGIQFVPAEHSGCSQKSEAEGDMIREVYASLMQQQFQNRQGEVGQMGCDNVMIVTPYNVQVNYLRTILPEDARVGTVDMFQGQEAEVVLISMVTSSGDDLPRHIEFLYSKNRLNVAISRARTLAVLIASPQLLEIACQTIDQMRLVNTLCWVKSYAESLDGEVPLSSL